MAEKGIMGGIVTGANGLLSLVLIFLSLVLVMIVGFIVVGAFSYQVEQGNIPVTNQTNTSVQSVEDDFETVRDTVSGNTTTILSFVALAVILMIVGGLGIFKYMKNKGQGGVDF